MSARTFLADKSQHASAAGLCDAETVQFEPIIEDGVYHGMIVQSALERVALEADDPDLIGYQPSSAGPDPISRETCRLVCVFRPSHPKLLHATRHTLEDRHCTGRTGHHVTHCCTPMPRRDRCQDHSPSNISISFFEKNRQGRSFSLATARRRTSSGPVHRM